jgi:hypothetical protein
MSHTKVPEVKDEKSLDSVKKTNNENIECLIGTATVEIVDGECGEFRIGPVKTGRFDLCSEDCSFPQL